MKMYRVLFSLIGLSMSCMVESVYLFDAYPALARTIAHVRLGAYPTPIYELQEMAHQYGMTGLYIKDDGISGMYDAQGRMLPSGNKVRKLEFLLADAQKLGYKTVCTVGSAGSNHALATAICARQLGMDAVLVLNDQRATSYTVRNLQLMALFAKEVRYFAIDDDDKLMEEAKALCQREGYYYIAMGGSSEIGELGYINAVFELKNQIDSGVLPEPDVIYITLGSAGTATGVILGARAAGLKSTIIPVRISSTVAFKNNLLASHVNQTGAWLKKLDPSFPFAPVTVEDLTIEHNFAGGENTYALITPEASQAIDVLYKESARDLGKAIKLEGTYTGKTFSALLGHAAQGLLKNKVVLFWNTFSYGTAQEFITDVSDQQIHKIIPQELRHYLTDRLQDLDRGI